MHPSTSPTRLSHLTCLLCIGLVAVVTGCGSVPKPRSVPAYGVATSSPLGPSYVLLPLPTEDDDLLGRVLPSAPDPARSLEEIAQPNPCLDKLALAKTTPSMGTYQDAEELAVGGHAHAMLGIYGFAGDAQHATHFFYKIETQRRSTRASTPEYVACCQEKGCGYGYVSALVFGEGEYATAEEDSGQGQASVLIAAAGGTASVKILHRRKVRGWLAALVSVPAQAGNKQLSALGVEQQIGGDTQSMTEEVKSLYEKDRVDVESQGGSDYVFKAGGATITENEFVRRFNTVTGSDELNDLDRHRGGTVSYVTGVGLLAAGAAALTYGVATGNRHCKADDAGVNGDGTLTSCASATQSSGLACAKMDGGKCTMWYDPEKTTWDTSRNAPIVLGALGVLIGGGVLVAVLVEPYQGTPTDHFLTRHDALLYADRYNRSLIHRLVRDVQRARTTTGTGRVDSYAIAHGTPRTDAVVPQTIRFNIGVSGIALEGIF